jgi:hypothetical protein
MWKESSIKSHRFYTWFFVVLAPIPRKSRKETTDLYLVTIPLVCKMQLLGYIVFAFIRTIC